MPLFLFADVACFDNARHGEGVVGVTVLTRAGEMAPRPPGEARPGQKPFANGNGRHRQGRRYIARACHCS
jgi:hypothetical protein